jgi:hypothetical protein
VEFSAAQLLMAGAAVSGVADALEAQAKTMATQAQLLQQICDRLDVQDRHWEALEHTVARNAASINTLTKQVQEKGVAVSPAEVAKALSTQFESKVAEFQSRTWERIEEVDGSLSKRVAVLESWRPFVEHSVVAAQSAVDALRADISRVPSHIDGDHRASPSVHHHAGILGAYGSMGGRPPATSPLADGPRGHRDAHHRREDSHGFVYTQGLLPHNGTLPGTNSFHPGVPFDSIAGRAQDQSSRYLGQLPKMNFPSFDGDSPKLWQKRAEDYFTMYSVDPIVWIKVSTMHFTGAAARWLQSVEGQLSHLSWMDFCHMIRDRFGKDQHAVLIRQLFHIRQTSSVADYVDRFSQLVDQLRAYCPNSDPL